MADNEHTAAALGHSVELSVKHPPSPQIPEFCQRSEENAHVSLVSRGQKTGDIFDNNPARSKLLKNSMELEPESGSLSSQALALSGNGDILTGKSSANKVNATEVVFSDIIHISISFYVGPVSC